MLLTTIKSATSNNRMNESFKWESWTPKRGEIYLVNLGNESMDCEQRGVRPFLILSNNIGNAMGSIVVGLPISSRNKGLPKIHVPVGCESGIKLNSFILTEHIRSITKRRFFSRGNPVKVGEISSRKLIEVENAIRFELGFIS